MEDRIVEALEQIEITLNRIANALERLYVVDVEIVHSQDGWVMTGYENQKGF